MRAPSDRLAAAIVFLGALAFYLTFSPFDRPLGKDPATWDLMATFLPRGMVPYRDIFLHKTPGAALIGALGAALAPVLRAEPVHGAHFIFLVLAAAAPALLYASCRAHMAVPAALAAAAFMVGFDQWLLPSIEGVRPKVATTTLGLASLLAATRGRPICAGALGSGAALCWQPGVVFLLGAVWELLRDRDGRLGALVRAAVGAALPLVVLAASFAAVGAFGDFIEQAVLFNRDYVAINAKDPARTISRLTNLMRRWSPIESLLLLPAAAGLLLASRPLAAAAGLLLGRRHASAAAGVRTGSAHESRAVMPAGLAVAGIGYLALTFVSLQGWPDTILFTAPAAAAISAGLSRLLSIALPSAPSAWIVLLVGLVCAATPHRGELRAPITFADQAVFFHELAGDMSADDTVLVIGVPEFSIHTGRRSVWPWPYMWFGVDRLAAAKTPGGFPGMLEQLDRHRPALMLVARQWGGPLRALFRCWARPRYVHSRVSYWPHTHGRPMHVYRARAEVDENKARAFAELSDFEITGMRADLSERDGGPVITVELEVDDAGCGEAVAGEVGFYLSADRRLSSDDVRLIPAGAPKLRLGAVTDRPRPLRLHTLTLPALDALPPKLAGRLRAGKAIRLVAAVDPDNGIAELDESNNERSVALRFPPRRD